MVLHDLLNLYMWFEDGSHMRHMKIQLGPIGSEMPDIIIQLLWAF